MKNTMPCLVSLICFLLLFAGSLQASMVSDCAALTGCKRSICEKEKELAEAKQYNDIAKVFGIEKSLFHLRADCSQSPTGTSVKYEGKLAELEEEYQDDLKDALNEYRADLRDAQRDGKQAKIQQVEEKYQQKKESITNKYQQKMDDLKAAFGY